MKRLLLLALPALLLSCGPFCRSTSDCREGEHCDFTVNECKLGCTTDEQCGGPYGGRKCDTRSGRCRGLQLPIPFPADDAGPADARTSTTSTSTRADAGAERG